MITFQGVRKAMLIADSEPSQKTEFRQVPFSYFFNLPRVKIGPL
jgi:hypothetical protein